MQDVQPFELGRMLFGDITPLFMLEILFRTVVIFLWLLFLLRLSGQRSVAELGPLELAIVIALGSAAGDPMFYPEVPLVHAMLVLALVLGLHRLLIYLILKNEQIETAVEGTQIELVRNGVLNLQTMQQANLSREDVFEYLRNHSVRQLGEVQRAYLEQKGTVSVYCWPPDKIRAGLAVVPPWDIDAPVTQSLNLQVEQVCMCCGASNQGKLCSCPDQRWTPVVYDPLAE